MPYELSPHSNVSTMMLMLLTGRVCSGAIGLCRVMAALFCGATRGPLMTSGFLPRSKLMRWYPLPRPCDVLSSWAYVLSESKIADDLYKMFSRVGWADCAAELATGRIGMMVLISAMNGLSVGRAWPTVQQIRCRSC